MENGRRVLDPELERERGVTIDVRIGVHTGQVVAGDPSTGQTFVTGDAVNVAARPVAPLDLKGKAEPVRAHALIADSGMKYLSTDLWKAD